MLRIVRARVIAMAVAMAAGGVGDGRATPARKRPEPRDRTVVVQHRTPAAVPVWGLPDAPVTVDFFYNAQDYQLGQVWNRLMKLSAQHPHRLRIRHHLIEGQWLAETALEANSQGRFFELMNEVINNPMFRSSPARREELCARAGVDFSRVERADTDGWHLDAMARARAFMHRRMVTHTRMALLFNGRQTPQQPWQMDDSALEETYDAAHERALALLEGGVDAHHLYGRLLREIDLARPPARVHLGQVDGFLNRRRTPLRDPRPIRLFSLAEGGHRRGPDDAGAVIHFFCSMQSKLCAHTATGLDEVRKEFEGELAVVFHDLYDPDDSSQPAAGVAHQLLRCAEEQASYWQMWDLHVQRIFTGLTRPKHLTQEDIEAAARATSIDPARVVECMAAGRHELEVKRAVAAANAAGIRRTPSIVIGGMLYEGSLSADSLRALVIEQLLPGMLEQWAPIADRPR